MSLTLLDKYAVVLAELLDEERQVDKALERINVLTTEEDITTEDVIRRFEEVYDATPDAYNITDNSEWAITNDPVDVHGFDGGIENAVIDVDFDGF